MTSNSADHAKKVMMAEIIRMRKAMRFACRGRKSREQVWTSETKWFLKPYFEACELNLAGLADWDQKMPKHPKNFVERLEQKRRSWRKTGVVPKAADSDKYRGETQRAL